MTEIRKKLEALVEREATEYVVKRHPLEWSWEEKEAYRAGAHLLLDAVVELQEALERSRIMYRGAIRFGELNRSDDQSRYMRDLRDGQELTEKALSSLEKRIAEARASGEENCEA